MWLDNPLTDHMTLKGTLMAWTQQPPTSQPDGAAVTRVSGAVAAVKCWQAAWWLSMDAIRYLMQHRKSGLRSHQLRTAELLNTAISIIALRLAFLMPSAINSWVSSSVIHSLIISAAHESVINDFHFYWLPPSDCSLAEQLSLYILIYIYRQLMINFSFIN